MNLDLFRVFDIETSTHGKGIASPYTGEDWVVTVGTATKAGIFREMYFGREKPADGWLAPLLDAPTLVAHNMAFDLSFALHDNPYNAEAYRKWLLDGGVVWDTQIAEYVLRGMGQQDHQLSLDAVAPRYGGEVKEDAVKALWASGVSTEDIDREILSSYLEGDIRNTRLTYEGQLALARRHPKQFMQALLLDMRARMASLRYQVNGLRVDKPRGLLMAKTLQRKLDELDESLRANIPAEVRDTFNWNSIYHRSALLFGGYIDVPATEYRLKDGTYTLEAGHPDQAYVQMEISTPFMRGTEPVLHKSGKNAGKPKVSKTKVDDPAKPKTRKGLRPVMLPGLAEPSSDWALSTPGLYQTGSEIIAELGGRVGAPAFLKDLAARGGLAKDLGTYFITRETKPDGTVVEKGMLTMVYPDGCIHPQTMHCTTVTGRLSGKQPNPQNFPRGDKSQAKLLFRSRFEDGVILSADFTSLEVYCQATLTACPQLLEDLNAGMDMHTIRVGQVYGVPYDQAIRLTKGYSEDGKYHPADPVWEQRRTEAKPVSFQRAYGAGAPKIARATGLPLETVEAIIAAEEARYPEVGEYFERLQTAIEARHVEDPAKVVRHPERPQVVVRLGHSLNRAEDGRVYTYPSSPAPEFQLRHGKTWSISPTIVKNYRVQGTGASWMKAAMYLLDREVANRPHWVGKVLPVSTVHDALYLDVHPDFVQEALPVLAACMRAATSLMHTLWRWPAKIQVPAVVSMGPSMGEQEEIPDIPELHLTFQLDKDFL